MILVASICQAQENSYRNAFNQYYWKNRSPKAGYWQQDVHYNINATLSDQTDIVDAVETLTYFNNSPDTLFDIYFHLYQNAFQPESYAAILEKANGVKSQFGKYEAQKLGTAVESVSIDRTDVKPMFDNTIMRIHLAAPIMPGKSIQVTIKFKSYFDTGSMRRRMKTFKTFGFKHYDCVHWYPRICVYDAKFGWETDQHLGKEFYGDFGSFDVELNLPSHYVLEATGLLQNPDEALPAEYRAKIDINNFAKLPNPYIPNACNPADGKTKTWKFHADNVHDFAWTADPLYRIHETEWNGVKCVALAQEPNAPGWQETSDFVAKVVKCYSTDFGMYAYPKMVAADARDGMEYPMLTLDGGWAPGNHGVIAHEVGHNWFFGMVGSNETYRAALDEGFTQFLTAWSLRRLDGEYPISGKTGHKYYDKFKETNPVIVSNVYMGYLTDAMNENDEPLNTHSDQFNGALGHGGGYRHVYYKTATMLMNLEYVLGDELFRDAMSHYFNQWKICHPYFEDFRNSIIQYTHVDLNWFFDQWMETTKRNDYSIEKVSKVQGDPQFKEYKYSYVVKVKRNERMQMPVDLAAIDKNGDTSWTILRNTYFVKKYPANGIDQYWKGWDNLNETYEALIFTKAPLKNVVIDPSRRMADVNYLNNIWKCPKKLRFDAQIRQPNDLYRYRIYWRPDLWFNAVDGVKAGLNLRGHYMQMKHIFEATVWYNTGLMKDKKYEVANEKAPVNYLFTYKNKIGKNQYVSLGSRYLDGLYMNNIMVDKVLNNGVKVYMEAKALYRDKLIDRNYALESEWQNGFLNNVLNLGFKGSKVYNWQKANLDYHVQLRTPSLFSDYNYTSLRATLINTNQIKKLTLKTRWIGQFSTGNIAPESRLNLAGANGEEMVENKYTRSIGIMPNAWQGYGADINHFHFGGGLNLRGYAGYLAPEIKNGTVMPAYNGKSGTAINAELEFDRLINWKPKGLRNFLHITPYLFGDAGVIWYQDLAGKQQMGSVRADAGLGMAVTIKRFGRLDEIQPLTIRFDCPLYISNAPAGTENIAFRWVMGINRAF